MHKPRKLALAVLASITIAGIAGASASSLGGLSGADIGSDDAIVASCQGTTGAITVHYNTAYDATGGFMVGTVDFGNVDPACNGKIASLVLADATGTALASVTTTVSLTGSSFTLNPTDVPAHDVEKLSLVIQG